MFIFDNVLNNNTVDYYRQKIDMHYNKCVAEGCDPKAWWPSRNIDIKNEPVIQEIKTFIESKIHVELTVNYAELQTWYVGSYSILHKHDRSEDLGDYNSMLYLNNDFEGGEFFTENIMINPIKNRLTFFDGKNIMHGVRPVHKLNRYTIIVWWRETKFGV